jgi:hypothetical protein
MKKEEIRFEPLEKPEIEGFIEIIPDTSEFSNQEKAEALIKNLSLSVGDTIQEIGEENYIINPRMVLKGNSPEYYKETIKHLKNLLTQKEIGEIKRAINRDTKKYCKKLYDRLSKKIDNFYFRGNIKKSLSQEIKESLEFFNEDKHTGAYNTIYNLLSKDKEDYIYCYKCAFKGEPIPNIQKWRKVDDGEYLVLTDDEAEDRARDFLVSDDYLWRSAVEHGNTTESLEDWADSVLKYDGRGSILSSYDGGEDYEEVGGEEYYIYRTN